jgi:hypothetical protein
MAQGLRYELRENLDRRITVYWRCGGSCACTTGILVEVGFDFIEVAGLVPTFVATEDSPGCIDPQNTLLETIIPFKSISAFVEGVPSDRNAGFPVCCADAVSSQRS